MTRWAKNGREQTQQTARLFDDLVSAAEQRDWEGDTERRGGLKVYDQLDLRRPLYRQIGWLFTLENPAGVDADQAVPIVQIGSIAHQATSRGKFAVRINRWQSMACCERYESIRTHVEEWIITNDKCTDTLLDQVRKGRVEVTVGASAHNADLPPDDPARRLKFFRQGFSKNRILG
jgi:hypothetical protein